jgi:hypothetical protein
MVVNSPGVGVAVTDAVAKAVVAASAVSLSEASVCSRPVALAARATVSETPPSALPAAIGVEELKVQLSTVSPVPETAQVQLDGVGGEAGKLSPVGSVADSVGSL